MRKPIEERFWAKVNKTDTCWLWTGYITKSGYGRIKHTTPQGTYDSCWVHRISMALAGFDLGGLQVDHICRVRRCVNPDHLRLVSLETNLMENSRGVGATNAMKTHCPKGHEYYTYKCKRSGSAKTVTVRYCKQCKKEQQRPRNQYYKDYYAAKKARSLGA